MCLCYGKKIADFIYDQMRHHYFETETGYRAEVTKGFTTLRTQNFSGSADKVRDFRTPAEPLSDTRKYLLVVLANAVFISEV